MWTDDIKDWSGRGMVECIREAGDRDVWKRRVQRSKCPNDRQTATGVTWRAMLWCYQACGFESVHYLNCMCVWHAIPTRKCHQACSSLRPVREGGRLPRKRLRQGVQQNTVIRLVLMNGVPDQTYNQHFMLSTFPLAYWRNAVSLGGIRTRECCFC